MESLLKYIDTNKFGTKFYTLPCQSCTGNASARVYSASWHDHKIVNISCDWPSCKSREMITGIIAVDYEVECIR